MGLAVAGLEEGSEFVPVFSPDGSTLEGHVTLFDNAGGRWDPCVAQGLSSCQVFELCSDPAALLVGHNDLAPLTFAYAHPDSPMSVKI